MKSYNFLSNFSELVEDIKDHEDAKKVAIILNATSHLVINFC